MIKLSSLNFMIFLNILSSLFILSSSSLILTWIGIEIISISLPPLIMSSNSSIITKINSWKYFMIQCYSSSMFVASIICISISSPANMNSNLAWMMVFVSMMVKMGLLPFHGWIYQISSSISWENFLIMSTIQKVGPLAVIGESSKEMDQLFPIETLVSMMIVYCSMSIMFILTTRSFMIISSITNSMWMIIAYQMSKFSFFFFLLIYFSHLILIFLIMKSEFSFSMPSLSTSNTNILISDIIKSISILSILGMPPLGGFFMKLSVVEQMINQNHFFLSLIMTMSSSIFLLIYFKINYSIFNQKRNTLSQSKKNLVLMMFPLILIPGVMIFFL